MIQILIGSLPLRVDCCDELPDADDVHDPRQIVGEHAQSHFGSDVLEPLHQEVGCAQAHLDVAEGMYDHLPTLAHGLRVLVETPLPRTALLDKNKKRPHELSADDFLPPRGHPALMRKNTNTPKKQEIQHFGGL
jgi:hypothetical protein